LPLHFHDAGHEVDTTSSGQAGLRMARSGQYRVVVLDLGLPRSTAKRIFELQGGEITLTSEPARTAFTIALRS
jgi:DNA-binding response OmpR family regulator